MPTRQLVSVDDEAPVAAPAVPAGAADAVVAPADSGSSAPPQQSSAAAAAVSKPNPSASANTSTEATSTEAKTVTPKKDGDDDDESGGKKAVNKKKGGRSKKGGSELSPNQRTLGSFFGAAAATGGAKKSKPKPKPKSKPSGSKDAAAISSKPKDVGAKETGPPSSKSKQAAISSTATATANTPETATSTSDKIKAIVLGSARQRTAASATITSSSVSPAKLLGTATATASSTINTGTYTNKVQGIGNSAISATSSTSSISAVSTAALIGIPNGAIPSQKQIQMLEERARKEEEEKERRRLEQQQHEEEGKVEEAESESSPALPSAAASLFVSPTPPTGKNKTAGADINAGKQQQQQQQQKKGKKRATLISVTSTIATAPNTTCTSSEETPPEAETEAKSNTTNEEQPIAMEVEENEHKDGDEDDDVIMVMDDEENAHDLTGTAAKGSAVEGTKVLDVTLGKDSDRGEEDEEGASSPSATTEANGAQDVSKKLNFATPNKREGTGGTAAPAASAFGGLDAFAVPISSIKASKKAKAAVAVREAANAEGESYVNKRIAKEFDDGKIYRGTVTKYTAATERDGGLWHIAYEDDDEEDLNLDELQAALKLFESEEAKTDEAKTDVAPLPAETSVATPPSAAPSPTAAAAVATATPTEHELPDEFKEILAKHEALRKRYRERTEDLVQRSMELSEEDFDRTIQPKDGADEETTSPPEDGAFPESLLSDLAVLIQGSPLPLSTLTSNAVSELVKRSEGKNLTTDVVSAKIKILASRKQYLTPLTPAGSGVQVDKFEDTQMNLMWRWELTTIELLPSDLVKTAKKVVSERRKLQNFFKAVVKLLSSLDKADVLFLNAKSLKVKRESALAKISADEDKVLKFEREEEKQRLIREAKAQKEKAKLEAKAQKDQAKKAAAEKRELEKKAAAEKRELEKKAAAEKRELEKKAAAEKKEQEKKAAAAKRKEEGDRKKIEATKAKEDAKRKKEEEKAAKKRKAEAKVLKQRACMASFFGASSPSRSKTQTPPNLSSPPGGAGSSSFDSDAFWKSLGTVDSLSNHPAPFKKLSKQARESRKRKTKEVAVTVFATVMPDNPFDQQPYDEERILKVPNKYKFLAFHEDYRPPYHGTWSKPRSSIVNGRNPLGRDTAFLDYDVDSEAEWEEGDDEEGEDCEIDGPDDDEEDKIDGEEGDTRMYNYDDGWLAQDDEYDVEENEEDNDEDTVAMRKRKVTEAADAGKKQGLTLARVCVVAPVRGGIPLVEAGSEVLDCPELVAEHVDGADVKIGKDLLASHEAFDFMPCSENCLDLFPAPKSKKAKKTPEKDGKSSPSVTQASKEMTQDDLRAFAKFVHNSTLGSKDKVIEELQTALPDITSSRAQATRKLDSIAEKRRLKYGGGVVWEVKSSVLESLNLEASDLNPAPVEKEPEKKAAKSPKRKKGDKKEKDPNAPKRPSSAYIFYSNTNRQNLKEANKEAPNTELLKLLGESWKALSAEEKQPYEDMAAKDKVRYQTEMAVYKPDSADEPAEKKAKTIDIQDVWREMKFREVSAADLVKSSRVLVNHKGSLFKATIHKSRSVGESFPDFQVQYFGNKATTLHWKPFCDMRALLNEKDEPIVIDVPAAAASAEALLKVAGSAVTVVQPNVATESSTESIAVDNMSLKKLTAEAEVSDSKGTDTDAMQPVTTAADSVVITSADGSKGADAIASEEKPVENFTATAKAGKKRPAPATVSAGSKNLLASFLKKKAKKN